MQDDGVMRLALVAVAAVFAAFFGLAVLAGAAVQIVAGGTEGISTDARTLWWVPLVAQATAGTAVPQPLELGLIATESGGNYTATDDDANGTVDAGLAQINSGPQPADPHWAALGLSGNPYAPAANVAASVRVLAADLAANGSLSAALYAYNGGTPSNGLQYDPAYAPKILAAADALDAGPHVYAWPVGSQVTKGTLGFIGGGLWEAAPLAGTSPGTTWVLVTAAAPTGAPHSLGSHTWRPLLPPSTVTATVDGQAVVAQPSTAAPKGLAGLTPPDSAYWWFPVPLSTAETTAAVTATWTETTPPPTGCSGCQPTKQTITDSTTIHIREQEG